MTKPKAFITSVSIDSACAGPHEYVSVFIRGQNVGTLCVGKGDGAPLKAVLMGEASERETVPPPAPVEPPFDVHQVAAALFASDPVAQTTVEKVRQINRRVHETLRRDHIEYERQAVESAPAYGRVLVRCSQCGRQTIYDVCARCADAAICGAAVE